MYDNGTGNGAVKQEPGQHNGQSSGYDDNSRSNKAESSSRSGGSSSEDGNNSDSNHNSQNRSQEQSDNEENSRSYVKSEKNSDDENSVQRPSRSSDESDDVPLSKKVKKEPKENSRRSSGINYKEDVSDDDEDNKPLSQKKKKAASKKTKKKSKRSKDTDDESENDYKPEKKKSKKNGSRSSSKKRKADSDEEDDDDESDYGKKPSKKSKKKDDKKKVKKEKSSSKNKSSSQSSPEKSPTKRVKKVEDEQHVWKWWEEKDLNTDIKWRTMEHKGPVFAPDYEPLPDRVKFKYDGKVMKLSPKAEEVATFYGKMLDHDYVTKDIFNKNFFKDWKKYMTPKEKEIITDLKKCDFKQIDEHFKEVSAKRKEMSKEEKKKIKEDNERLIEEYGNCLVDGHKQKIGNFRIEPPGLFRGRGDHPKMGKVKKRIEAEEIIINIGKKAPVPAPPPGHKWKEVRHDNTVTWLSSWNENIMNSVKYIMLNPSSKLKSMKDWMKYEKARDLSKVVEDIRKEYTNDWKNREMVKRQRAVALYFIDRLALRAGNEKDGDETADTVGCCSLRVEHIKLFEEKNGKENVVEFDFLGKDSIRYENSVSVEKRVFKNLKIFLEGKKGGDDVFDRLNTATLNKYLNTLMDGLSAKVFRTYNASITLQKQLDELMVGQENVSVAEKMLMYNRANRAVAILCNHQRSVPKTFDKQMENLRVKIGEKREKVEEAEKEKKKAKKSGDSKEQDRLKKKLATLKDQLMKLEVQEVDKDENKQIALGTSKLNYLDPRISVAW